MRFHHALAALAPIGVASAFATAALGGSSVAAGAATTVAGHVTPEVASPLAYKYVGRAGQSTAEAGYLFTCQEPGASPNCYTPQELAAAYDIPATLTGAGQTIVIIDAFGDPTLGQDLAAEERTFSLPPANLDVIYPDGKPAFNPANADEVSWTGEIALDVESAHAIAPAATIDLVIAKSDRDPDMLNALKYAVSHHLGSVLSQSYGEAESCEAASIRNADHTLFEQAEAEGMSVFAASGDTGAAQPSCNNKSYIKSVGLPAADPLVTSVGAVSLTASQPNGTYESETAWNDSYGSSNGGYSKLFPRPSYQDGFVDSAGRGVPDVSLSGDVNNGLLIAWSRGQTADVGNVYEFGGTSAASPQWAAITALADQDARHPLGFLNARLYALAHGPLYGYVFHDVTTGNSTFVTGSTSTAPITESKDTGKVRVTGYAAANGWDPVTGLGTPVVAHLLQYLPNFQAPRRGQDSGDRAPGSTRGPCPHACVAARPVTSSGAGRWGLAGR
jgi:subtilase family serine protease